MSASCSRFAGGDAVHSAAVCMQSRTAATGRWLLNREERKRVVIYAQGGSAALSPDLRPGLTRPTCFARRPFPGARAPEWRTASELERAGDALHPENQYLTFREFTEVDGDLSFGERSPEMGLLA